MDDLLAEFVAETREMLAAIEGELVAWEADPADRTRLDAIFRFVHTVKGNCGFFDFPRLEQLSHAAESALAEVRAGRRAPGKQLVSAVLAVIDRIVELMSAIEAGEPLPAEGDQRLIAALEPDGEDEDIQADTAAENPGGRRSLGPAASGRSIRLPVSLLDRLMSGISDMVLARNDLARRLREAGNQPTIDGPFERLSAILDDVREGVTRMRMQRIEHLYNALPRLVRDLGSELGKQVMLDLQGGEVELDREMIEVLRDPLTHIIRNAIDHGIEPPSQRLASGKREIGLLTVSARQAGNRILVAVSDDGRGLDLARICTKAVAHGIGSKEEIEALSHEQQLALIFEPGLSTAETVSEISGRGVGMDVVRANLEKVGGAIRVESEAGEGTRFVLELPLTLSIIAGLTLECGGCRYALPRSYIEEIARGRSSAMTIEWLGETSFVTYRGQRVPAISLARVLGLAELHDPQAGVFVFIRLASGDLFALVVDRVLDNEDLVVKPLAPAVMAAGIYAGSTLLDDGNPILLLDLPSIAARHQLVSPLGTRRTQDNDPARSTAVAGERVIVFIDMAGRRRAVRMAAVQRIQSVEAAALSQEGNQCRARVDGLIVPVAGLHGPLPQEGHVRMLRLGDGVEEILYAASAVDDSAELSSALVPLPGDPMLEGSALIDGTITAIIDAHALFALHGKGSQQATGRRCRQPAGDTWAQAFLAPMLEAAGYRIASADDPEQVDIIIAAYDEPDPGAVEAHLVRIRTSPEPGHADDNSVYRYDREGLLAALARAAGG